MNKNLLSLILPEPSESEARALCEANKIKLEFDVERALFPVSPLSIEPAIDLDAAIQLCQSWSLVSGSIESSIVKSAKGPATEHVYDSLFDSSFTLFWPEIRDSVFGSSWSSVRLSLLDFMRGYETSIYFAVEDWIGVQHEKGVNPFQPAIDLWEAGYIASYDGEVWRLHTKDGIAWSGSF